MDYSRLCMGCMRTLEHNDSAFCPFCGYRIGTVNSSRGLQPKTVLNGKYLVGKIIGEGGFGITYLAYDMVLNYRVAIKEYFPSELVTRDTSTGVQTALTVLTGSREEQYKAGIERFVNEARNLAAFNNLDGIVSVKEFFYENNTAYMVMEYIDGISLSQYLNNNGNRLPYQQVISMLTPIMNSLEKVHESNIIHRDISPDNIMVSNDGRVKLIDFGAARMVDPDNKSLTVILKHGYAPEEQYQSKGNQGPWTDVYALAATMYRMITGTVPQEATDRIISGDKVVPVNKPVSEVPRHVSDAIMHGLAIKASDRPQSISVFRKELEKGPKKKFPFFIIPIAAAVVLCVVGAIVSVNVIRSGKQPVEQEYVAKKTKKNKKEEPVSEEESEVPPVKELTEEEKLAQWKTYQNAIFDTIDLSNSDYDSDELYGLYDDYDGNGTYELFIVFRMEYGGEILYSDEYGVQIVTETWDETADFTKLTRGSERAESLCTYIKNYLQWGGSNLLIPEEIGLDISTFGKQKLGYYSYYQMGNHYGSFSVLNEAPAFFKQEVFGDKGAAITSVKCFTSMGEEIYAGDFYAIYPITFIDGKFGEVASCELTESQYSGISGLIDEINTAADIIKDKIHMNGYVDGSGWPCDGFTMDGIKVDSVYYNEEGYFIINYRCFCTFTFTQSMDWKPGTPYYVSMVENFIGEENYSGNVENMEIDTVRGVYAHAIIYYDGKEYKLGGWDTGYIGASVTDNVVFESKCPYVQ